MSSDSSDTVFSPKYSLAHLTLLGCSTPELVYIAARTGYDAISPRLISLGVAGECPCPPLDGELLRATKNALNVTGITVQHFELAQIIDQGDVNSYEAAIAVGAELGAKGLIASAWTTRRDDRNFIVDSFAGICDIAERYGISVALEFPTFSRLRDLAEAIDVVQAAARPNGGILVDTLYSHMSRVSLSELESLPSEWVKFIQVCDVLPGVPDTTAGMVYIARDARLYPGDGCIDFKAIIERLPPVDYSIELPNRSRVAELGYEEHARRCLQAAKKSFGSVTSKRPPDTDSGNLIKNQPNEKTYGSRTQY